jgi:nucleoside-diphosphate-sugar epimerase
MRVLVLGGAGVIGSHARVAFAEGGHDVAVVRDNVQVVDLAEANADMLEVPRELVGHRAAENAWRRQSANPRGYG